MVFFKGTLTVVFGAGAIALLICAVTVNEWLGFGGCVLGFALSLRAFLKTQTK